MNGKRYNNEDGEDDEVDDDDVVMMHKNEVLFDDVVGWRKGFRASLKLLNVIRANGT
jgi:hypothetical protein